MRTDRVDRLDREESAQRRLTGKQGERKDKEIVQGWEKEGKIKSPSVGNYRQRKRPVWEKEGPRMWPGKHGEKKDKEGGQASMVKGRTKKVDRQAW